MQDPTSSSWFTSFEENLSQVNIPPGVFTEGSFKRGKSELEWENLNPILIKLLLAIDKINESISNQVIQLYNLESHKYSLKNPISIITTYENGLYYAETVDFNIYSEGQDIKEAVNNLKTAIISYYESLRKHKRKLSKKMRDEFTLLSKLIKNEK